MSNFQVALTVFILLSASVFWLKALRAKAKVWAKLAKKQ